MKSTEFTVEKKGGKLTVVLSARFPQMSYGTLRKLLRKGEIRVNGQKVFADGYVNPGDVILLFYDFAAKRPKCVYEDRHIAVFFKPYKIPTVGQNSFEEQVKEIDKNYVACHRLDTNTEGLVVFAKDAESESAVRDAVKKHLVEKHYLAFVDGIVSGKKTAVAYLKKDENSGFVKIYEDKRPGTVAITTTYEPIKTYDNATAVDVTIFGGKTHQIRAHLAYEGYPIIGDPKYGDEETNRRYNKSFQMLTAYKLVFLTDEGILSDLCKKEISIDVDPYLDAFISL